MNQPRPKIIIALFLLTSLLFLLSLFILQFGGKRRKPLLTFPTSTKKAQVISALPENGDVEVALFTPIIVEFEKEVTPNEVKLSTDPKISYTVNQPRENRRKIRYELTEQLKRNTLYKITIDAGYPFTWEFITRDDLAGAQPEWEKTFAQQEKEYEEQYAKEDEAINTLRKNTPIITEGFKIDFSYETGEFIVTALKGDPEKQRPLVIEYLRINGVRNFDRLKIRWP